MRDPEDGPCELRIMVSDPEKCKDMRSPLKIGDLIKVRGVIVPFAYFEGDGERAASLILVARSERH